MVTYNLTGEEEVWFPYDVEHSTAEFITFMAAVLGGTWEYL